MSNRALAIIVAAAAALGLVWWSAFTVSETQLAIKLTFKEIVRADYQPGLHFMTPFWIDSVEKYPKMILTESFNGEQFLTNENKQLDVAFYIKWRISDVTKYRLTTGGQREIAKLRLGDIVRDGIKRAAQRRSLEQFVAAERSELMDDMLTGARTSVQQLGITIVDVRMQRVELPDVVISSVYERMRQDYRALAARYRAEGEEIAQRTRAEAERDRVEILAEATRQAQQLRGEGDALATDIYSKAYTKNPEFYSFYRSLEAYRNALGRENDVMVLAPDSEFFKYLKNSSGK
ncbi:MAG TPA: protease modulator HflC [Steroidobacteraceae bacterium]|nr:protease modulator HflC [Steroidobacteraceae bacterium]